MTDTKTGRASDQFPLRLPDGMRDQIRVAAELSGRSMNAEIVFRLEATLTPDPLDDLDRDQLLARLKVIQKVMADFQRSLGSQ